MKRTIVVLAMGLFLSLIACGNETKTKDSLGNVADSQDMGKFVKTNLTTLMSSEAPDWIGECQKDGILYQGLNLDGVGEADDEAYVSVYEFGDYHEEATVLKIHLGTGETLAKVFPVSGRPNLKTGKLFSKDKEAIVLEITDRYSNYGATTVFALDVYPALLDPFPSFVVRLDTTSESVILTPTELDYNGDRLDSGRITQGAEAVDVDGKSLQGLQVLLADDTPVQYYWTKEGWTFLSGNE